jgi:hypothetical protein
MAILYEVELDLTTIGVEVGIGVPGPVGPAGPQGDPGITVSSTAPSNPQVNDLWLEIP